MLDAYPEASLWLVSLNPVFEHRRGTIRVLFGAQHLPGELDRRQSQAEFEGIKTARALRSDLHIQSFLDAFLLSLSPWSLGLAFERYNGALVLLFGRPQGGGGGRDAHMMQDLHRVAFSSALTVDALPAARPAWHDVEQSFVWWIDARSRMFRVMLDPTRFCATDDSYLPEHHFGALLSLERFMSCITSMLVYYRRDEFVRRMLMYDALDSLTDGLKMGDAVRLFNGTNVAKDIALLESSVPAYASEILLPRSPRRTRRTHADGVRVFS